MTTMTSPPSPLNLCNHQASKLPGSPPRGAVCFRLAMICPGDFVRQYVPRGSASPSDLKLDVTFEDHGVSWLTVDEIFGRELVTY